MQRNEKIIMKTRHQSILKLEKLTDVVSHVFMFTINSLYISYISSNEIGNKHKII